MEGGRSVVPVIASETVDVSNVLLDYRRTFNWYNLDGVDANGNPHASGPLGNNDKACFLKALWTKFTEDTGLNKQSGKEDPNFGGKIPVSFYTGKSTNVKNSDQLLKSPAYVDQTTGAYFGSVVVNPGLWKDGGYADGIFHGQITFAIYGTTERPAEADAIKYLGDGTNPNKIFPIAIWLDKDFIKTTQD